MYLTQTQSKVGRNPSRTRQPCSHGA